MKNSSKFVWATDWIYRQIQGRHILVDCHNSCTLIEASPELADLVCLASTAEFNDSFKKWLCKHDVDPFEADQILDNLLQHSLIREIAEK